MLFLVLVIIQIIICAAMAGLILIQRSEGGALGMGGGPSSFMSARGTGNLLTTATAWLAFFFFANSIALTVVGNIQNHVSSVVDRADTSNLTLTPQQQADAAAAAAGAGASSSSASFGAMPLGDLPLAGSAPVTPPASSASPAATTPRPAAASNSQAPTQFAPVVPFSATPDKAPAAKASVFRSTSSSAAPASSASKPSSSSASVAKPSASSSSAPAASAPAGAPAGSSSTTPQ